MSTIGFTWGSFFRKDLPIEVQREMATSTDASTRERIAGYWRLAAECQQALIQDPVGIVRHAALKNPALTPDAQMEAVRYFCNDPGMLYLLCRNLRLSREAQVALSCSSDNMVVVGLLGNPRLAWSREFNAHFVKAWNEKFFKQQTAGVDPEVVDGLLPSWQGSLDELAEAAALVRR